MRVRLFIACSGPAVPLAKALRDLLSDMTKAVSRSRRGNAAPARRERDVVLWDVVAWWEKSKGLGKTIISMLKEECAKADLAVTLLTEDDLTVKRGTTSLTPRDNCIFEAGLFMGGLGLEECRSVLVSSVEESAIPGDLKGIKYLPIPPATPERFRDHAWCRRTARRLATDLTAHALNELRDPPSRPVLPVLSATELFERERSIRHGGDLQKDTVVINTLQPAEAQDLQRARQVVENMLDAGVDYLYFFRENPVHVPKVISLLKSLVVSQLTDKPSVTEAERTRILRAGGRRVVKTLREIQKYLHIHFLPDNRAPLLLCVHNAFDVRHARCYLRDGSQERFYIWGNEQTAFHVAADFDRFRDRPDDHGVFYPSKLFNLYATEGRPLRKKLEIALRGAFGNSDQIQKLCFLDEETTEALAARSSSSDSAGTYLHPS